METTYSALDAPLENTLRPTKKCTTCCKEHNINSFIGSRNQETKTCNVCRERNNIQNAKRDRDHYNALARKNDAKPERKEVKKKWKENNYEKIANTWMKSRKKQIENLGVKEYLKKNAENAHKWRDNNPDKVKQINEDKRKNKNGSYKIYMRTANLKNLDFSITLDEFLSKIESPCYYCGIIQEKGFNGIDRIDQTNGYISMNTVSCCEMCNYTKGNLDNIAFIKRICHILSYHKKIEKTFEFNNCFSNHNGCSYNSYQSRATKKQVEFTISNDEYTSIINQSCYICGKKNTESHMNGIDRFDNNIGYIIDNVRSCCGECNYMKKDYNYDDLMNKYILIYSNALKNNNLSLLLSMESDNNQSIVKTNKKSHTEIIKEMEIRKLKQQTELVNRHNDNEYIKNRAVEIAQNRKNALDSKPSSLPN